MKGSAPFMGRSFSHYQVLKQLGAGSMGDVYLQAVAIRFVRFALEITRRKRRVS